MTHQESDDANLARRLELLTWYCQEGMRLIPVYEIQPDGTCACITDDKTCPPKDRGKHPRLTNWGQVASSDLVRVMAWHRSWPTCNWAWVLDDHFVVDSDPRNGGFGPATFYMDWEENIGFELPPTRLQATGGGGVHAVYRQPGIGEVGAGKLWLENRALSGLEIKGRQGNRHTYVLVEPSNHASGGVYRWLGFEPPADPTPELLAMKSRRSGEAEGTAVAGDQSSTFAGERFDWKEATTPGAIPPGDQQSTLYRAAASLRGKGITDDEDAVTQLLEVARGFRLEDVNDPWTDEHALEIWERAKRELPLGHRTELTEAQRNYRPQLRLIHGDGEGESDSPDAEDTPTPPGDDEDGAAPAGDDGPDGRNTDKENAEAFVRMFGDEVMWTPAQGWWVWDGVRWQLDHLMETWRKCSRTATHLRLRGELERANRLDMVSGMNATLSYASSLVARRDEDLDTQAHSLNCPNGVLNLDTGELRPCLPADRLTRVTGVPYEPDATSPLLEEYLTTFMPRLDHQEALFRLLGACLPAGNEARLLLFLVGGTTSGKSQLASGLERALGSYVGIGNVSIFRGNLDDKPRPDIMKLLTTRVALLEEAGSVWDLHADRVKHLTGGGTVSVRGMRSNSFIEREPAFNPVIVANEMPMMKNPDLATFRRMKVAPFTHSIQGVEDPSKKTRFLADENCMKALLAMITAGYLRYREQGIDNLPHEFELARAAAFDQLDDTTEFLGYLRDKGWLLYDPELSASRSVTSTDMHESYVRWVMKHGDNQQRRDRLGPKQFGQRLQTMGWQLVRSNGSRWAGYQLRDPQFWVP